jgi:antibiotic biosynthesis monooxygenase (ABM) superfamily enzyme
MGDHERCNSLRRRQLVTADKKRMVAAFVVAAISDGLSFWLVIAPPLQWAVDLVTALLLFFLLGRKWVILPGLIAEAIPGLNIFPFWLLVVGSIATWGAIRRPQAKS